MPTGNRATRSSSTAGAAAKPISAPMAKRRGSRATGWCGFRRRMSARDAMAIGTAGYTAMLAVMALERPRPRRRRAAAIAVTGAAGGVGSVAIAILAKLGFTFTRSPGGRRRPTISRAWAPPKSSSARNLAGPPKPLAKERWAGGSRRRRLDDAGQPAVDDPLWRRGGRLRTGGRHGPADDGRPVYFARRVSLRHRFRDVPAGAAAGGLETPGNRPGPRQDRGHDREKSRLRRSSMPARASSPARCAAGSW